MTPTVSISIDVAQPRLVGDRLAKVISGRDWDLPASSNVYLEHVAWTGMLMPLPATAGWLTTTTGNYARLRKSELTIAASTAWVEYERSYEGNWYQHSLNSNVKVYTLSSQPRNRAMFLSFLNYNAGNEVTVVLECGWGEGTDAEVELRFWSDGSVEIWRNDEQLGSARIDERVSYPSPLGPQQTDDGSPGRMLANETIDLMLIPGRRRELLCLSNMGGGFNFLFEDLDPEDPDPTICGAGPFWFYVPEGQATVQIAPLHFATSGVLLSPAYRLREPPGAEEVHTERVSYDLAGYGTQSVEVSLRETNGTTLFEPDGELQDCRLRVDLAGDGDSTPFVYGCSSAFEALTTDSADSPTVLDEWWMEATLDVPEDPEGVTLRVAFLNPQAVDDAGAGDIRGVGNRDIEAKLGDISFFIGRTLDPEWEEGPSDETTEMILEARDRTLAMAQYRIQDPEPIGGMNFSDSIEFFARMPGFQSVLMDIGAIDYRLPSVAQNSGGEQTLIPEVGDTPVQWVRRLWEEFAQKCFWGWVPTVDGLVFRFKTPAQLGSESAFSLYLSDGAAQEDGRPAGDTTRWIRQWKPKTLLPEANDIYVVGRDARSQLPIIGHARDLASLDPTTAPENRPDNWVGHLRQFGYVDPSLTTEADVLWALGNFQEVLPVRRRVAEFRCEMMVKPDGVPVWRGDVVTIKGAGSAMDGAWRIRTLSALFDLEYAHPTDALLDRIWRETTYVAERERVQ